MQRRRVVTGHDAGGRSVFVTDEAMEPVTVSVLPGLYEVMEPDHPGMHITDTVDFDVVMSGEVWLELDDRQPVHLRPGDRVVQNGTRHAWHNRTSEPVTVAVALIGARRR